MGMILNHMSASESLLLGTAAAGGRYQAVALSGAFIAQHTKPINGTVQTLSALTALVPDAAYIFSGSVGQSGRLAATGDMALSGALYLGGTSNDAESYGQAQILGQKRAKMLISGSAEIKMVATGSAILHSSHGNVNIESGREAINIGTTLVDGKSLSLGKSGATQIVLTPHGTAGSEKISITNTAGDASDSIALVATAGGIDLSAGGVFSIDGVGTSNVTTKGALTVSGSSGLSLKSDSGVIDIDSRQGAIQIDGVGASNFTTNGALTLSGSTGLNLKVDSGTLDIENRLGAIDIDAAAGALSLDGAGGVTLGTQTNGVAVSIGHTTSETTVNDNLNVTGNAVIAGDLTVEGNTVTLEVANVTVEDRIIGLNFPAVVIGSALASGAPSVGAPVSKTDATVEVTISSMSGTVADGALFALETSAGLYVVLQNNSGGALTGSSLQSGVTFPIIASVSDFGDSGSSLSSFASLKAVSSGGVTDSDAGIVFGRKSADLGGGSDKRNGAILFDGASGNNFKIGVTNQDAVSTSLDIADDDLGILSVGRLQVDGTNNHIDVSSDVFTMTSNDAIELASGGSKDIVLDPASGAVVAGANDADTLGSKDAVSGGSGNNSLTQNLTSGQTYDMGATGNVAILYGSSVSAADGSALASGMNSISAPSDLENSTTAILYSGSTGQSLSAGDLIFFEDGSSNKKYYYVTAAYSGGTTLSVAYAHNIASNHSSAMDSSSVTGKLGDVSSFSGSGYTGSSLSASTIIEYDDVSGNTFVFSVVAINGGSSSKIVIIANPDAERSDSSSMSSSSFSVSSTGRSGGSTTTGVYWKALFANKVDLNGQSGGLVLDQDGDTKISAATDDEVLFTVGGSSAAVLDSSAWRPSTGDSHTLGTNSAAWGDLFLASGGEISFNSGDVKLVHTSDTLTFEGASSGYIFKDGHILPHANSAIDLGSSTRKFRNIFTGDLNLENDRGSWTLIEENDFITFRNNKTGRRFMMIMEDITGTGTYGPGNDGEM